MEMYIPLATEDIDGNKEHNILFHNFIPYTQSICSGKKLKRFILLYQWKIKLSNYGEQTTSSLSFSISYVKLIMQHKYGSYLREIHHFDGSY